MNNCDLNDWMETSIKLHYNVIPEWKLNSCRDPTVFMSHTTTLSEPQLKRLLPIWFHCRETMCPISSSKEATNAPADVIRSQECEVVSSVIVELDN